ncbi:MAG: Tol-Pal system beta propeller repeat protein TolB [Arenicellales bacterium]
MVKQIFTHIRAHIFIVLALFSILSSAPAQAILTIDITKGVKAAIPIAIVPFRVTPAQVLSESIWDVVASDLSRSGRFEPLAESDFLSKPSTVSQIQYKDWRLLKMNAIVIGEVQQLGGDQYKVSFRLMDVFNETQLVGNTYPVVKSAQLRKVAHKISDIIYEKLTGIPGAFDTKIAYVMQQGVQKNKRYFLQISDADGYRPVTILESAHPIMAPAWSQQADRLAYVSFEKKRAQIYVQDLRTGQRTLISDYPRINSSPAWSPDGSKLAMSLSKDGNSEIYVKDVNSGVLTRLTRNGAIDTEPSWSPDGRNIVFSSGRAGKPQIYQVSAQGGSARRMTFQGGYNAGASYSSDGRKMVLITDVGGGFKVGIYDVATRNIKTLTNTRLDESPSFSPNGEMILYSTVLRGKNVLSTVSSDGNVTYTHRSEAGSVKAPAWSPKL